MLEGAGVIDRSMRHVLRVSGPDRLEYLNTLLSQKLDDAAPGSPRRRSTSIRRAACCTTWA